MGKIVSKVLGIDAGKAAAPLTSFKPTPFTAGGLSTDITEGRVTVAPSAARTGAVQDISQGFTNLAGQLSTLGAQVTPGFGRLTESIKAGAAAERERFEATRRRTIGNLRENLAKRRVAGSSFAMDALARAEAEFEKEGRALGAQEQQQLAQSFLQELDTKTQLIEREAQANIQSFTTLLDEMNLEAQVGTQLASGATAAFQANAALQANLIAEAQGTVAEVLGLAGGVAAGKFIKKRK